MTLLEAVRRADQLLPGVTAPEGATDDRWQRILDIGLYIDSDPDGVWDFVARWGSHEDADLRDAIATCLLEHLLERHFDALFPRVELKANSDRPFADTVKRCWKLGQAELPDNAARFDALIARHSSPPAA